MLLAICAVVIAFAAARESRSLRRALVHVEIGGTRRARLQPFAIAVVAGFALSGCANYHLGTSSAPGFRTLYVEPVGNKTTLPQAREIISTRLREAFARDGRVVLANSSAEADATLTVTIVDYHRSIAAVREDDTGLARKFDLVLGVDCTLRTRDGKAAVDHRRIDAVREAFTDGGQLQSEYQTLPLLADALATKVVHTSLDVW